MRRRIRKGWLLTVLLLLASAHASAAPPPVQQTQPTPVEPVHVAASPSDPDLSIAEPDIGQAGSANDPAAVRHVNSKQVIAILGNQVKFADGSDVGRIVDVLVDRSGETVGAVLDCGGFMGVGNRKVAVSWISLHFSPNETEDGSIIIDLTPDQVRSAPEYREASDTEIVTTRTAARNDAATATGQQIGGKPSSQASATAAMPAMTPSSPPASVPVSKSR